MTRRTLGRLRRGARLETVWAHHFGSHACKPSAGSPSGRRMAPRSTTSAPDRSRPRCTVWCSSTWPSSSPRPRPAPVPSCPGSSRTSPMPSRSAASWPTAPFGCAAANAATKSCCVQLQAPRALPVMRCAADVADGSAPGGPCHPARTSAAMGTVAADPAARAAGRAAVAGHASAAGGATRGHAASAGQRPSRSDSTALPCFGAYAV